MEKYLQIGEGFIEKYGPGVLSALLILIIGLFVIKIIVKLTKKVMEKSKVDITLQKFLGNLLSWALKILLIVTVITQLGVETTSFAAIIGAAGLAVALALKGSMENLAAGILLVSQRPFKKGDFVAELDRSEIMGKLQDAQLDVQQAESQVIQAQLDTTLTLSQARDNLINLRFALEEREIEVEQSKYESPAVQRQAEIELDRARRQLTQETKNYQTKVKQSEAQLREVETELQKKRNVTA